MTFNELMIAALTHQVEIADAHALNAATLLGLGAHLTSCSENAVSARMPALQEELRLREKVLSMAIINAKGARVQLDEFRRRVADIHGPQPAPVS